MKRLRKAIKNCQDLLKARVDAGLSPARKKRVRAERKRTMPEKTPPRGISLQGHQVRLGRIPRAKATVRSRIAIAGIRKKPKLPR